MSDYQVVLRGLTMGDGTDYRIGDAGINGLGVPKSKTADVDLDGQDGAYGAPDYMGVRVLLIPVDIIKTTDTDAWDALSTLNEAWEPVAADIDLVITVPGWGTVSYTGRPRGLEANVQFIKQGVVTAIGEFHALDPTPVPGS